MDPPPTETGLERPHAPPFEQDEHPPEVLGIPQDEHPLEGWSGHEQGANDTYYILSCDDFVIMSTVHLPPQVEHPLQPA